MSFQDIETGQSRAAQPSSTPSQSREDPTFMSLQSSLSLQVFKINSNVQGILKLVDQLGTTKDSPSLRKHLCVNLALSVDNILRNCTAVMTSRKQRELWLNVGRRT